MTKQKNKLKKIMIIVMVLMILPVIISATLYDKLQSFESTPHCRVIERDSISDQTTRMSLFSKFGLTTNSPTPCFFVIDSFPFHPDTQNLIEYESSWYESPWYSEIYYVVNGTEEYLFILGNSSDAIDDIANFTANYDDFQNSLRQSDSFFYLDETFWDDYNPGEEPPFNECTDNPNANIYLGNSVSYFNELIGESSTFDSYCMAEDRLAYFYCEENVPDVFPANCNCVNNKCIASSYDIFKLLRFYGTYTSPGGRLVDNSLVNSGVSSWINN